MGSALLRAAGCAPEDTARRGLREEEGFTPDVLDVVHSVKAEGIWTIELQETACSLLGAAAHAPVDTVAEEWVNGTESILDGPCVVAVLMEDSEAVARKWSSQTPRG